MMKQWIYQMEVTFHLKKTNNNNKLNNTKKNKNKLISIKKEENSIQLKSKQAIIIHKIMNI